MRKSLPVLLTLSIVAAALAQQYTLKRTPKVGDIYQFKVTAELSFDNQVSAKMTGLSTEKVTKVEADGSYSVESSSKDVLVTVEGNDLKPQEEPPVVTVFKPNGSIATIRGAGVGSTEYRAANVNTFRFPEKPVAVGDSWKVAVPADARLGVLEAEANFTLEAVEKVGEVETLRIKYSYAETGDTRPVTAEGQFWIETANGSMVKSQLTIANMPMPKTTARVRAVVTAERQP